MPDSPAGLDDPDYAAFAWRRYRHLLAWMVVAAAACVGGALAGLAYVYGPLGWFATGATVLGVGASVMMAAALMGLAFLSSGSGHDEAVRDDAVADTPRRPDPRADE